MIRLFFFLCLFFIFSFILTPSAYAFNCTSNVTSGNFNVAGSWTSCNNTTPQTTDTITIANGHTITLVGSTTVAGITVNSGGTLAYGTQTVTDTGNFTVNGSITGTTSTLALSGSGATIDGTGTYAPTGTITVTNNKTINSTANLSIPGALTISSGTTTNNGTITVNGNLTGSGGWTQAANSTLNAKGGTTNAMAVTTVNFTTNTPNTVNYALNGNQTAKVANYYNLTISGGGTKTLTGITTINGTFTATSGTATIPFSTVGGNFINNGATSTLATSGLTVSGNLTVSAGSLTTGAVAFTVNGTTEVSGGTFSLTSNTGAKTFAGTVTVDGGTLSGASTNIVVQNGISQTSGSVNISGTVIFNTNNQILSGTQAIATITVGTGITLTNNGSISISGTTMTLTGNWTQGSGSSLEFPGSITFSGSGTLNASTNANTIIYDRAGTQTLKPIVYSSLTLGGSGAKTMTSITTINGTFTVGGSASCTTVITTIGGNFIVSGGAPTLGANLTLSGNLTVSSGTLTTGAFTFTVNGTTEVSGGTFSLTSNTGAKTLAGAVTVDGGTLSGASTNIVVQNGISQTSGSVNISGTVIFNTNNQILSGMQAIATIVNGSGITVTNNGSVTSGGTVFTLTGNWKQGTGSTLTFSGAITFSGAGTFDTSTNSNIVVYSGANQTCKTVQYYNLQFTGSGTVTCTPSSPILGDLTVGGTTAWTLTSALTINGNINISGGTLTTGAFAFAVNGSTTINSGTLSLTNNTGTKLLTGSVSLTGGTLSGASTNIQLQTGIANNGGTVSLTGMTTLSTSGIAFSGSNTSTFGTLTVNNPATITNNGTVAITGTFSGTGSWTQGTGSTLLVGGSNANAISISAFDASTNSNTVNFNSTSATQTVNAITYNNLTIDKLGQTANLGGNITALGDIKILNGTLNTTSANHYSIDVKGNWSNADTFIPNTSMVTFDGTGNQTINNPNAWYGLTITGGDRMVFFQSGVAQTIAANGSLTLQGTSGHLLTLAPVTAGASWQLTVNNTNVAQSISYTSVSYSDASGGHGVNASNGTNTDGGNNTNWTILISISLDNTNPVELGSLGLGSAQDTTPAGTNDLRVVTVNNGPVALNIKSTNFIYNSDTWSLGTSAGANTARWQFSKDGTNWTTFTSADPASFLLDTPVAQGATKNLYFRLTMPTSVSLLNNHSSTVTVMATAP
jgi:hypothetical protein